jgi:hypothetical protein
MRRLFLLALTVLTALTAIALPAPTEAQAQANSRCFPETGYCVSGPILKYWERNGGLEVFGYPISELRVETVEGSWTGPVQWFERDRLEDHGAQGVLAGRLGATILELEGRPWHTFYQVDSAPRGCRYFPETGHSLCQPFASYWEQNGGLERFGYPISEPQTETIGGWTGTVQYFERRRMEHHIENRGTPFEVLLGLLGSEVLYFSPPTPTPHCSWMVLPELSSAYARLGYLAEELGCPGSPHYDRPAAIQNFEYGQMIWTDVQLYDKRIYALLTSYGPRFKQYADTWKEGDSVTPNVTPPAGNLYTPRRGFGKVWMDDPNLRSEIGWAVEQSERAETATVQLFDFGAMVWLKGSDMVYVFGPSEYSTQILSRQ